MSHFALILLIPWKLDRVSPMTQPQPASTPYYPPPAPPHGHSKYVAIIAALAVLVLIVGAVLGESMASNVAQTSNLNNQIDSLNSQVNSLRSQVSSLQSQVDQFNKVILKGDFTGTYDCPAFSNCSYFVNGAYANVGGKTAYSASVVFTHYSGSGGTGQILCTTTYVLGDISPQSVHAIPEVTCGGTTSTPSQSFTWNFNWT